MVFKNRKSCLGDAFLASARHAERVSRYLPVEYSSGFWKVVYLFKDHKINFCTWQKYSKTIYNFQSEEREQLSVDVDRVAPIA